MIPIETIESSNKRYLAYGTFDGRLVPMVLVDLDEDEARAFSKQNGLGFHGVYSGGLSNHAPNKQLSEPKAVDVEGACRLLGGVSRSHIESLIHRGLLDRLPDTRRVLVTMKSINRYVDGRN